MTVQELLDKYEIDPEDGSVKALGRVLAGIEEGLESGALTSRDLENMTPLDVITAFDQRHSVQFTLDNHEEIAEAANEILAADGATGRY